MKEEKTQKTLNTYTTNARREQKRWLGFFTGSFLRGLQSLKTSRMSADDLFQKWKKSQRVAHSRNRYFIENLESEYFVQSPPDPQTQGVPLELEFSHRCTQRLTSLPGEPNTPPAYKAYDISTQLLVLFGYTYFSYSRKISTRGKKKPRVWNRREKQQSRISSSRCFNQAPGQKMF